MNCSRSRPVTLARQRWGMRSAVIGGMDMDFMVRATPEEIRKRVRETLDICQPGGGYALGWGTTVANYLLLFLPDRDIQYGKTDSWRVNWWREAKSSRSWRAKQGS